MDIPEVVAFIDKFRSVCSKVPTLKKLSVVRPAATTVSHLLCEEARYRWLGVAQKEGVAVDDITCIVVQVEGGAGSDASDRFDTLSVLSPAAINDSTTTIFTPKDADPLRNSIVPVPERAHKVSVSRNDATRGSLVQENKH